MAESEESIELLARVLAAFLTTEELVELAADLAS